MTNQSAFGDEALRATVDAVAKVCLHPRFDALFKELEALYTAGGMEEPRVDAFRDAYYAVLQENGAVESVVKATPVACDQSTSRPVPTRD